VAKLSPLTCTYSSSRHARIAAVRLITRGYILSSGQQIPDPRDVRRRRSVEGALFATRTGGFPTCANVRVVCMSTCDRKSGKRLADVPNDLVQCTSLDTAYAPKVDS
jgi:hypothetical protein